MIKAPIPDNDAERVKALRELLILDTPPEQRFDRIVEFAAREFEVPTSQISLIDEKRQWFKAKVGSVLAESDRETSFCGHAILSTDVMVVPDALQDHRFFDNPWVAGTGHVRFYAGAPLVLPSGHVAGTLCVVGTEPRAFDAMDQAILASLRDLCVEELLARKDSPAMEASTTGNKEEAGHE